MSDAPFQPRGTVLVVSGQRNLRLTTVMLLRAEDYVVLDAATRAEALDVLGRYPVDLLIADLDPEPTDGFTLIQRALEAVPRLPVLALTAFGSVSSAMEALRLGAADYIAKPFKANELHERVQRVLRQAPPRGAEEAAGQWTRRVNSLLGITHPRPLELRPQGLEGVLEESLAAAARTQAARDDSERPVRFILEVEPGLPPVPMDREFIRQALVNLAVNALQAMPQGGQVHVRAQRESRAGKEHLRVDVADQGPGIPEELLPRVFEPFFTTKAQGTGLGLVVAKRNLEDHHGELAVESVPGRGTTFTFWLPFEQPRSSHE
jgi:signal transduction histidine kinase